MEIPSFDLVVIRCKFTSVGCMFTGAMIEAVAVGKEDAVTAGREDVGTVGGEGVGIDEIGGGGGVE